ncbi:hypothetical protein HJC23_003768 [Cyclotella cryptica]|uniref:Protein BCCIP homolog n=1 Tax=Cyclotella cryptica TaxID=29204 RepID=A0ABD3QUZ9_9STRA|eukprot:CCRYP_002223-RA/>CCRYP_002223-RA protein AED:0.45 eAED:0.45 QI:0/-1/0/1/-1/1/1/0/381
MAKKRKSADKTNSDQDKPATKAPTTASRTKEDEPDCEDDVPAPHHDNYSDSDDSSASSSDDSLVLEGELIRNPDADVSDDDSVVSSEEEEEVEDEEEKDESPEPSQKKAKQSKNKKADSRKSSTTKKTRTNEPETIQVEFLFCDMNEQFFHGIKTLLHRHGIHAPHSSQLADLIIENVSVGTVLSTDYDPNADDDDKKSKPALVPKDDPNVFGFASVINLTTHNSNTCIQSLKALCLQHCPSQHKSELETVLSGKTKRPAGFFFQERVVNVPLEITEVLHKQLVLDMDWAVENAEGGEDERKSLDFGAFVRLAPCYKSGGSVIYKYFDDEVFATNAEFVYTFDIPKMYEADEEEGVCSVIVLTKTGHRDAMKDLGKMIGGK